MAVVHKYVDFGATGSNDGSSPTDAWTSLSSATNHALFSNTDENYIWVRREAGGSGRAIENFSSDIPFNKDGCSQFPIKVIAWPRTTESITSATWTNNSDTISSVVGVTLDKGQHTSRYITGPDGNQYLIAEIVGTTSFKIEHPYPSSTVSSTDGACTIQADEHYATRPAAGQSAGWDSDDPWMPKLNGQQNNICLYLYGDENWWFEGLHLIDFKDSYYGFVLASSNNVTYFIGCFFELDTISSFGETLITCERSGFYMRKCVTKMESSYVANSISISCGQFGTAELIDCKLHSSDYNFKVHHGGTVILNNIFVDNERTDGDYYFYFDDGDMYVFGRDVTFANNDLGQLHRSSYTANPPTNIHSGIFIENYGHILGKNYRMTAAGILETVDVGAATDPVKRTDGSDRIYKVQLNNFTTASDGTDLPMHKNSATPIDETTFELDAGTYNEIRFYVQAQDNIAAGEFFIEVEYVSAYDETNKTFTKTRKTSTDSVSARANSSDWTQYVEVTNLVLPVKSNVVVKMVLTKELTTAAMHIDPMPYITTNA